MNPAFPEIDKIPFEGPKSKNPLAFKHYNADEVVEGKTMADHLRFSRRLLAHLAQRPAAIRSARHRDPPVG